MPKPFICRKCGFDLELAPRHDCAPLTPTPSKQAKALGFKDMNQVKAQLGFNKNGHPMVSSQTLDNWSKNKPELFDAVLMGVAYKLGLLK